MEKRVSPESLKEDGRPSQQWYWDDWFSEFGLRLCSLAARGLWIDMLGVMFKAEIRGTLTINGKQVDNKALTKITGESLQNINKYLNELEENDVFSRLENGTIYSRRLYRESKRKEEVSRIRARAGQKGMETRWGKIDNKPITRGNNKTITKITAPIPSSVPTSIPTASSKDINSPLREKIISHLNEKTGKNFSLSSESTIKFLNGRISEGYVFENFEHVIDIKSKQWLNDPEMNMYLRPSTLFNKTKFENYLNEKEVVKKPVKSWAESEEEKERLANDK